MSDDLPDRPKFPPLDQHDPFDHEWFKVEGAVLRLLRARLKSEDEAFDALYEMYQQLKASSTAATILDMRFYTLGAAAKIAAARIRSRRERTRLDTRFMDEQSATRGNADEHTPEHICNEQQEQQQLDRQVSQLPAELKDIYQARLDGKSAKWIAEHFGLELRTVYRRIETARQWLRQKQDPARGRKS